MDGKERLESFILGLKGLFSGVVCLAVSFRYSRSVQRFGWFGNWWLKSCTFGTLGEDKRSESEECSHIFHSWVAISNQLVILGCSFVCLRWLFTFYHFHHHFWGICFYHLFQPPFPNKSKCCVGDVILSKMAYKWNMWDRKGLVISTSRFLEHFL